MEFIRVSSDKWCFEGEESKNRFFPFGSNFVFDCPETEDNELNVPFGRSYNIMTCKKWLPQKIKKAFLSASELGINLFKVFLPIGEVLDDYGNIINMEPSFENRISYLLDTAEETGVYISLCLAEWGTFKKKWWTEGGTFFGEEAAFKVYKNLWQFIAEICKDRKGLFSYNLAVEFYITSSHWGANEAGSYAFYDKYALTPWRAFLVNKYTGISDLNQSWNTVYHDFDSIPSPTLKLENEAYTDPVNMVADYNEFKECVTYKFLKMQVDAIKSIDTRHMVTSGFHPDQCGIVNKGKGFKTAGIVQRELASIFDYVTLHLYTHNDCLIYTPEPFIPESFTDESGMKRRLRACEIYSRFLYNGVPIILEEFGFSIGTEEQQYENRLDILKQLYGSVSGFMVWFFGDIKGKTQVYGLVDKDLNITDYGKKWSLLKEKGGLLFDYPKSRKEANTIIKIPRSFGLAPDRITVGEKILYNWDLYEHPVDYEWEGSSYINKIQERG